jgi:hypothetical protein
METVEHWWNGAWGTLTRRDVFLRRNPAGPLWEVEAREAGRSACREFATEAEARAMLARIVPMGSRWRRIGEAAARP